ncbi:MAG: cytochrome c [Gammaproteobacteria bacterium]|nr:cytochrome c [Gammaproteobacteria bacterium]MDH5693818.1 cytochrome c [Gammaproteobacteria bacterium]
MKNILFLMLCLSSLGYSNSFSAETQPPSQAAMCAGCHGPKGISFSPEVPNLAGQKQAYLDKAIRDYRSGKRKNPMMNSMVGSLSDDDIATLSSYYSKL